MALPSETSDTREQFTWSHCYDMSLTVTAPCHASVTSETRRERNLAIVCVCVGGGGGVTSTHVLRGWVAHIFHGGLV